MKLAILFFSAESFSNTHKFIRAHFSVSDPRTADLFLVRSPLTLIGILAAYTYFVTEWGPQFMKHRKAFDLRTTMIVYNIVQVLMNVYIFVQVRTIGSILDFIPLHVLLLVFLLRARPTPQSV